MTNRLTNCMFYRVVRVLLGCQDRQAQREIRGILDLLGQEEHLGCQDYLVCLEKRV